MKTATVTLEIFPSRGDNDLNWYNAFWRGELVGQTCKEQDEDGIPEVTARALKHIRKKYPEVEKINYRRLAENERYKKEGAYPHEH